MIVNTLNIMLVYDKYRMALFWSSFLWPSPRYRVRPLRKACVAESWEQRIFWHHCPPTLRSVGVELA